MSERFTAACPCGDDPDAEWTAIRRESPGGMQTNYVIDCPCAPEETP